MKESTRAKRRITVKMKEARDFVDIFISSNDYPPSYSQVQQALGVASKNTAYVRLRGYRHKMIKSKK